MNATSAHVNCQETNPAAPCSGLTLCCAVIWSGSGDIEAGVVAHGSLIKLEDVEAIQKPILFLYSANDRQIPDELREKIQGVLKSKSFPAEGVYYPNQVRTARKCP